MEDVVCRFTNCTSTELVSRCIHPVCVLACTRWYGRQRHHARKPTPESFFLVLFPFPLPSPFPCGAGSGSKPHTSASMQDMGHKYEFGLAAAAAAFYFKLIHSWPGQTGRGDDCTWPLGLGLGGATHTRRFKAAAGRVYFGFDGRVSPHHHRRP